MSKPIVPTIIQASGAALISKFLLILAGISSSVFLPLALNQTEVGQFFLAQIVIAILAIIAQCGFTFTIPSTITSAIALGKLGDARRLAIQISITSMCLAIFVAFSMLILFALLMHFNELDGRPWVPIVPIALATVPFTSQVAILTELLRAIHSYRAANNLSSIAGSFTAGFLIFSVVTKYEASLSAVLVAGLIGSAVCCVAGFGILLATIRQWPRKAGNRYRFSQIIRGSLPGLSSSVILFGLAQFDILLVSLWLGPENVALYGVAMRFSALLLLPLAVVNAALAPIAVDLLTAGKTIELQAIFSRVVLSCAALTTIGYLGFVLAGWPLIEAWNPSYQYSYVIILILGLGQVVHASCGVAGAFLMTAGDGLAAMKLMIASGLVTVASCLLGLYCFGITGLAIGSACGNVLQVVCFVSRVRSHYGLDTSIIAWIKPQIGIFYD